MHERVRSLFVSKEAEARAIGKGIAFVVVLIIGFIIFIALSFSYFFGPAGEHEKRSEFIVHPEDTVDTVAAQLQKEGLVRYSFAFKAAYALTRREATIRPGGYALTADMDALAVAKRLGEAPYLAWVVVPEGKRKEEIADLLTESLGWTSLQREEWLDATIASSTPTDGVYFPDIYLIPSDQEPAQVAARMRGRFDEATAPYALLASKSTLSWNEIVTLASLVERESAKSDKALVAGILMNRLDRGMYLQVDATLQYMEGDEGNWWPAPDPDDKSLDSPYNTYKYGGLPPGPIATPSLASLEAVLDPDKTSCLYYLHDTHGRIHCSTTYKAHLANVNRFLR